MGDQPPVYHDGESYDKWRAAITEWRRHTGMESKRQALAVRAKLAGKLRDVALKLDAGDLNQDNGLNFLLDKLDGEFRKSRRRKWDVPAGANQGQPPISSSASTNNGQGQTDEADDPNLSATEKARLRALKLSAKLAAAGKIVNQPLAVPPPTSNPSDQFKKGWRPPMNNNGKSLNPIVLPEVKKLDTGGYLAEFKINDVTARPFLSKGTTQELIEKQSGTSVTLRGEYLTEHDKQRNPNEKPLTMLIQADVGAKVQVAIHKISQVINNYIKSGGADRNGSNFGLTKEEQNQSHFVQDKMFIGLDDVPPDYFDVKKSLVGDNNANFQFVTQQTGAKVMLRGRTSGYKEHNSGRESYEALHIYISHSRQDGLASARQLCANLIDTGKKVLFQNREDLGLGRSSGTNKVRAKVDEMRRGPVMNNPYGPPRPLTYPQQGPRGVLPPPHQHDMQPRYPAYHQGNTNMPSRYPPPPHPNVGSQQQMNNVPPPYSTYDNRSPYNPASRDDGEKPRFDRDGNLEQNGNNDDSRQRSHRHSRSRSRSPRSRSPRSRSSRSPRRSRFRDRSRSKSKSRSRSPEDRSQRKFTEQPKKRRKFSEDPKLLEKSLSARPITETPRTPPRLQFREKKKEVPSRSVVVDPFVPPPRVPSFFEKSKSSTAEQTKRKMRDETLDIFKEPPAIPTIKSAPKALKMGALSSLSAYSDDSDSD